MKKDFLALQNLQSKENAEWHEKMIKAEAGAIELDSMLEAQKKEKDDIILI